MLGVVAAGPGRSGVEPGQQDVGFARAGAWAAGVSEPAGGFEVEQAFARLGAIDAAAAVGLGEGFEIGFGIAAEEGEAQSALAARRAVARGGIAAELAQKRADLGQEGGRWSCGTFAR